MTEKRGAFWRREFCSVHELEMPSGQVRMSTGKLVMMGWIWESSAGMTSELTGADELTRWEIREGRVRAQSRATVSEPG